MLDGLFFFGGGHPEKNIIRPETKCLFGFFQAKTGED